jgi:N-acetylglucosamine-6-phosphate deacetylase
VEEGRVVAFAPEGAPTLDASGLLVVPGFVDLQCNGAVGIDVASEPERMWELAGLLPRWGVTAWLPTIVTSPPGTVERVLAALAERPQVDWVGAVPLGIHVEGPFLAPDAAGAHDRELLQRPTLEAVEGWSRAAGVALVTIAPELPGALPVIEALVARDVVVSLGHSSAAAIEVRRAFDLGARGVTHLFNAMTPFHHREPGLAGVALVDERASVGLIADGVHVHPDVVALAQRCLGERLVLVTDAVAALGAPPGAQKLGRSDITLRADGIRRADGTLAGSDLSLDAAVRNLVAFCGCEPDVALHAASAAPADLLGDTERGQLEPGRRGDVAVLTPDLDVVATVVGGKILHSSR